MRKSIPHSVIRVLFLVAVAAPAAAEVSWDFSLEPEWTPLFQGVDYYGFELDDPRMMQGHAVRVDTRAEGVSFFATPPDEGGEREVLSRKGSSFLTEFGLQVAVNASPFGPTGVSEGEAQHIWGLHVYRGQLVSPHHTNRPAFALTRDNEPFFIEYGAGYDDAYYALTGFYMILEDGKAVVDPEERIGRGTRQVHPRTAIGVCEDSRLVYLLVVDGRRPGYSEGAETMEMAALLRLLGAHNGMNFDGGGSSTLVVEGEDGEPRLLNTPIYRREPGTERPVGNHLGIRADRLQD